MPDWLVQVPAEYGLAGLFLSAFLSATLLPGNSELALAGWLYLHPATIWPAIAWATLGNMLGGMTTYWLGRRLGRISGHKVEGKLSPRAMGWLRRFGSGALLLSWLPLLGDGLCFAAGWLGLSWRASALCMLLGKGLRYLLIASPFLLR
ncbi:YqaA family protein [Chitinimonas naiadis]